MGPPSGGSIDKVSVVGNSLLDYLTNLINHQFEDVLPFIYCCKGTPTSCDTYYDKRPSDNGEGYTPPDITGEFYGQYKN